jgi:Na+/proline symporter/signal transduction histidine kinase
MSNIALILVILLYLFILFLIAYWAEKNTTSKWVNNPYVYTLSLAVYCSAWTYYGSIGIAAKSGLDFLPIYLGPIIVLPCWVVVMRKIIKVSKQNKITSIADFISLRYGNNRFLGALVTLVCILGTVPYIALQLKALSDSYKILTYQNIEEFVPIFDDTTFYIAVLLALFATFYGTQATDASTKHKGIVFSTAFESLIKLVIFLILGLYVTFYLFDGTTDIYEQIASDPSFNTITQLDGLEDGFTWFFMIMMSSMAIFLLPRQFQMAIVENNREKHLKRAIWLFPLYILLFNLFIIFIAWGGKLKLGETVNADYYILSLPLANGDLFFATLVFIGGLSAIVSMVVVSTLSLSNMISNNLVIPYGFIQKFSTGESTENAFFIKRIRRVSIFLIIALAYLFYVKLSIESSLYSIGLISFVIIAQLGPSFFIGLYWKRGALKGAIAGIFVGMGITIYTLVLPFTLYAFSNGIDFINLGPNGIVSLKPNALFGLDFLSPPAHAFFWSMLGNTFCYILVSVSTKGNYRERNYAEMIVDKILVNNLQNSSLVWKGEAYVNDIRSILNRLLGLEKTKKVLDKFFEDNALPLNTQMADARLINYSERLLTGSIGGASAKILIASVIKEDEISLPEVLEILNESKENIANNKLLHQQSLELRLLTEKLKEANQALVIKDKQKDDFLDTVAHELKTPVTGIKATAEILLGDIEELPKELRTNFLENILNDSNRLSRLINNILDFEKLSNGREVLSMVEHDFRITLQKALIGIQPIANKKNIRMVVQQYPLVHLMYDEDRILQVLTNILSNAIKFCPEKEGCIDVNYYLDGKWLVVKISDNGKGIQKEDINYVFQKFYQSETQNTLKPIGSGLGLAICKHIIDYHKGIITIENNDTVGVVVVFKLPIN